MPQMSIRLDETGYASIQAAAQNAGKSMEGWARDLLLAAAAGPVVRERYGYQAIGPGKATVKRYSGKPNDQTVVGAGWDQATAGAMQRVKMLIIRNDPGDRESAVALMKEHFEIVVEVGL